MTLGFVTLGAGVTHSCFHNLGYMASVRLVFIMSVSAKASSTEQARLSLSGISIGSVDRVFV